MDIDSIMKNISSSENTKEMVISLTQVYNFLCEKNNTHAKRFLIKELTEYFTSIIACHTNVFNLWDTTKYKIHVPNVSPILYTSLLLRNIKLISDYKNRLLTLIDYFNELLEPKTTVLTESQIQDVIELLNKKYDFINVVTQRGPIDIFIFNNSHNRYNSMCEIIYPLDNESRYTHRFIHVFASKSEKFNPLGVFFHEIGHILQIEICQSSKLIPYSFIEMNKVIKTVIENDGVDAPEVFADIFSVAAMNNMPYENDYYFISKIPQNYKNLFIFYFNKLFEYAKLNLNKLKIGEQIDMDWDTVWAEVTSNGKENNSIINKSLGR